MPLPPCRRKSQKAPGSVAPPGILQAMPTMAIGSRWACRTLSASARSRRISRRLSAMMD
ncbi:hypothetical protein QFZ43_004399 [Streptomyces afghaniensis]|nr:hypothetical protein [Streptomyces afghaniensis]